MKKMKGVLSEFGEVAVCFLENTLKRVKSVTGFKNGFSTSVSY